MYLRLYGNDIIFSFDSPVKETGRLSESFDYMKKPAYATIWIQRLLRCHNSTLSSVVLWLVFHELSREAARLELDYLQNIRINWEDVWCIDDGTTICLMRKDEY